MLRTKRARWARQNLMEIPTENPFKLYQHLEWHLLSLLGKKI